MIVTVASGEAVEWVLKNARPQDRVPYSDESFKRVREAMDAVALMEDGRGPPLLIGGLSAIPGAPDIGHVWAVTTDDARGLGISLTKSARLVLKKWMERFRLSAVMSYTLLDSVENRRWMAMLGFEQITGPHATVMDDDGISWKGYVLWAWEKAGEEADKLNSRRSLISALYGSNTPAGKRTSANATREKSAAREQD